MSHPLMIGPSIMTADFLNLGRQIADAEAAGIDFVHLDVMDGRFVPNISFGLPLVEALRAGTELPLDVHLMMVEPERWVERFVHAGADAVTVHVEVCAHLHGTLQAIRDLGATPGITLNPLTPVSLIADAIPYVGQVLVMGVNPGFGGQTFIPSALDRIRVIRGLIDERNPQCRLEVDGGVKATNLRRIVEAGADMVVVGSGIYNRDVPVADAVTALRASLA